MPKKRRKGGKGPSERSYARLTRHERQTIERMLDRGRGCREMAREIGRAPSTVASERGAPLRDLAADALRGARA